MSRKLSRWMKTKAGRTTLMGLVGVLFVTLVAGQALGWWAALGDLISGTATLPVSVVTYPAPAGGYTCLPSCADGVVSPQDGQFLSLPGAGMSSFDLTGIIVWISVPGDATNFEVGIFDGDSGKDNAGNHNPAGGNWDHARAAEVLYTLYADPLRNGSTTAKIGEWYGNRENPLSDNDAGWIASATTMPNNAWYTLNVGTGDAARGPSGHYFYRLEAQLTAPGGGISAFKLRSSGYLSTGQSNVVNAQFAVVGAILNMKDVLILYPQYAGASNRGPSNYTGEWQFYLYLPEAEGTVEFWDGDFDFGNWDCDPQNPDPAICNVLDPIQPSGIPEWANPAVTVPQGTHARGIPADDSHHLLYRREPAVRYQIIDPFGDPVYINDTPSGSEEWKVFIVSSDRNTPAHQYVDKIGPGFYTWHIQGLDVHNTVWIRTSYEIIPACEDGPCTPPPVCDATCPRTIGYWKNNVAKVMEGRTSGVQETPESIEAALRLIALQSPLFRRGIDVANPQPLPLANGPLTLEEADIILQRKKNNYPDSVNTMLARALQQNLATWLNWGTGKVCDFTQLNLVVAGGTFEGRLQDALADAQQIMLTNNTGLMERAKDIGDKINNGNLGENANIEACADTTQQIPPDRQPPAYDKMPKGPKPDVPDTVVVEPDPDPATCQDVRTNTYGVEMTDNPFNGIKFEYKSGTEIKDGDFDEFRFVVTADQAAAMTSIQVEAKAAGLVGMGLATLEGCAFNEGLPCGDPVRDEDGYFAFYFMGAVDNGDGTMTLVFHVQNMTGHGLSHVTLGLPDGVVPSSPTGNYESRICQ